MKKKVLVVLLSAVSFCLYGQSSLKVITYNVLEGLGNEASYGKGRKEKCIAWIKSRQPDVIALQEWYGSEEMLREAARQWGHDHVVKSGGIAFTAKAPITHQKIYKNEKFWNTVVQARVGGIDFFVIHLSPADWKIRLTEAHLIKSIVDSVKQHTDQYMVLGDFNAHSPFDDEEHQRHPALLAKYTKGDRSNETKGKDHRNLIDYQYDYSVMGSFLSVPLIDVTQRLVPAHERHTFPTPILIDVWRTAGNIGRTPERIDYIMTSPELSQKCRQVIVHNDEPNDYISDHYPVEAVFGEL